MTSSFHKRKSFKYLSNLNDFAEYSPDFAETIIHQSTASPSSLGMMLQFMK